MSAGEAGRHVVGFLDFYIDVFRKVRRKQTKYTMNEAHKQYSILDTILNYIFHFGPPGNIYTPVPKTYSRFSFVFIDAFLEVQNKRYS